MIGIEVRTFEQRFGERCPFCDKTWGDPSPCGDSRADWTYRDGLQQLFADRVNNCEICDRQVQARYRYCVDCGQAREKYKNAQDRHKRVKGTCINCGGEYEMRADKARKQRVCSIRCGQLVRHNAARAT